MAIVSSGDPVKDQQQLLQAALHQSRMEQNICPNGCGQMVWDDPHTQHCDVCGFVGFCGEPYAGAKQV